MPTPKRTRVGKQKQGQLQVQIQLTEQRRLGLEELDTWRETPLLAGPAASNSDLGHADEVDGDDLIDEDEAGEAGPDTLILADDADEIVERRRRVTLDDLLGSRPPTVLMRVDADNSEATVRSCVTPSSPAAARAVELLTRFVQRCFQEGRAHCAADEWDQLLGREPAPLTRRLLLLIRLALKASANISLDADGQETGAVFTPHDLGLERFASKFAALPDGTPFSIRLLLLDQRGRKPGNHFFDQLPKIVQLLALRRALRFEQEKGVAVSDDEFRATLQQALEELLGTEVPKPTEDQVRRRLRDNFNRKEMGEVFPNRLDRQRAYDRLAAAAVSAGEERA